MRSVELNDLKKNHATMHLSARVRIFSREHGMYWRCEGRGYTLRQDDAWVLPLYKAIEEVWSCGPEKMISFEFVEDGEES